jgi:hypothetical protein
MLNLDTNKITPEGGLNEKMADEMGMQANLLPEMSLSDVLKVETSANTGSDPMTSLHMRNWMECVRSRKEPNARPRRVQPLGCQHHGDHGHALGKRVTFDAKKRGHCHGVIPPKTRRFPKTFRVYPATCSHTHSNYEETAFFGSGPAAGGCRLPGPVQNRHDRVQLKHDEANKRVDVLVEGKPFTSYITPAPT